ncbi:MAG: restriction endonuclease subunit S [Akkermansiaceae bacterium]|nr:restriction endonuclease subunit S [Akkermansiaceae bacterium]
MTLETFFEKFDQFADAPGAVAKMRELVLELAVQGKLVEQRPKELSAKECIRKANKPLVEVALDDSIETPAGWLALPLGCLIAANTGGGTPSKQNPSYWNGPIPWASVKDVQSDKYLVATIDSITDEGLKDSSSNLIPPNRLIVVTRMGLGKLAINTIPVAINQDLRAIEPTTALDLDFAYLLFKSLKMVGSGVTVKGITVDKLHAMHVLLPPLAEQKRIVAKVDELMALCDRLEAQQQERETWHAALARASLARFASAPTPANLSYLFHSSFTIPPSSLRKSILTLAVQGKLVPQDPKDEPAETDSECEAPFGIPSNWRWEPLGRLGLCRTGKTPPTGDPTNYGIGFPFIGPGQITLSGRFTASEKSITRQGLENSTEAKAGDILMVCIGGSIGKAAICREPIGFNQQINAVRLQRDLPGFVYLAVTADYFQEQVLANASGSATPIINKGKWEQIPIPLPPLAEQRRIVAKVEQLMALVDALETQLAASRATAAKLLSALVAELTN